MKVNKKNKTKKGWIFIVCPVLHKVNYFKFTVPTTSELSYCVYPVCIEICI